MDCSGYSSSNDASAKHINDLPDLALHKVFSYLDLDDLVSVSSVCRSWNSELQFGGFWENVVYKIPETAGKRDVERTVKKYPMLCNIRFSDFHPFSEKILKTIVDNCNDLRSLDIVNTNDICMDTQLSALEKFPRLEDLKMDVTNFGDDVQRVAEKLGSFMNLKRLKISSYHDINFPLKPIADGCPQIIHLDVQRLRYSTDELAYLLKQKKYQCKSLTIRTLDFKADATLPLDLCRNMENFSCSFDNPNFPPERILHALRSLPVLARLGFPNSLYLPETNLTNFFHHLSSSNLVELNLSGYSVMSDELADAIVTRCPLLRKIVFYSSRNVSYSGIITILKLPHLEHVEFKWFCYNHEWFVYLLQCKNLRHLDLSFCRGLYNYYALLLLDLSNLEYLNLSGCRSLSNEFLTWFPQNSSLKHLEILSCNFSERNVDILKSRYPLMKIELN